MYNVNDLVISESFSNPADYILDNEKSDLNHKYYIFQINGSNYRVNISRINSSVKTSYMFTLGSLSTKGSMVQFKFRHKDIYIAISTAIKIFKEWHDVHKNIFSSIVFKMPDKIKPTQMKIIEKLIKRQKIVGIEKIALEATEDTKHKYLFFKNKKKGDDSVLKGLMWQGFNTYNFENSFPAELLDELLLKTKLEKSHVIDQINLLSKGFSQAETAYQIGKQITAQELKVLDQKKDAIEKVEKEEVEETEESKKIIPKTEKDIEWHWNSSIGLKKKINTFDLFFEKLKKVNNGLEDFQKYLLIDKSENREPFKYINLFYAAFSEIFPSWNVHDSEDNSMYIDKAFFGLPQDYIKYFDFHIKNYEKYEFYTPYIFFGNKKVATDKLMVNPKAKIMDTITINGFYSKLASNLGTHNSIGRIKHENVVFSFFPSLMGRWDFVNFLRDTMKSDEGYSKSMLDVINEEDYYGGSELETKHNNKIENSEIEILKFIPLKGIKEPEPFNNILQTSKVNEVQKVLLDAQKKNCTVDKVPSILSYTGSNYSYLNAGFRDKSIAKSRQDSLMEFLKEYKKYAIKLSQDIEVSRKTNYPTEFELDKTYIDYSPLSASINHNVWSGSNHLRIKIPKGSPVFIAMGSFSNHSSEKEVILPPGSIIKPYRVSKVVADGSVWTECILMGNIFQHVYDEILMVNVENKKTSEDEFDVVDFEN